MERHDALSTVKLTVDKNPTLADEPFQLRISGLRPGHEVTLHASLQLPNSEIFESFAHYVADWNGCISLDQQASKGGSYTGVEPMGPLSFMEPSSLNKRKYRRFLIKDPKTPFKIDFRVLDGFIPSLDDPTDRKRFETPPDLTIRRTYMSPGVKEIPVWDGNVRATLYIPDGNGPFPGVISMSGGYPGAMKHKAALLASHGFAALALKYFGEDDLTDDYHRVELDYIEEAARFMINHKMVNGRNGIGIVANCYGAVIALSAVSVLPKGLIRCLVSVNGWPIPSRTLNYRGEGLKLSTPPFVVSQHVENGVRTIKRKFDINCSLDKLKSYTVPFYNRHKTSFLFIQGEKDGYLNSDDIVSATKTLLESTNHPDYEILYYKGAGHLIEHSYTPLSKVSWTSGELQFVGGEQPEHSIAQNDSWPKILEFVHKKLGMPKSKL